MRAWRFGVVVWAGLERGRGGVRYWWWPLVVETQTFHIVQNGRTVVVLRSVADATAQFGRFFLSPEDRNGVFAAQSALFTGEHGTTELVVIIQRRGTHGIGQADPLGHTARDGRVVGGALDGRSTDIDATLGVHAEGVAALALHEGFAFFGAGEGDERIAAVVRTFLGRSRHHVRTADHVILESHSTTDAIGAFETSHFTRLDARLIARQTPTIAAAVLGVQQRRCRRRRPTTPSVLTCQ